MTIKAFAVSLANELIARGIDRDTALSNVVKITRALSEDDLREVAEYKSPADFEALSESLVRLIEDAKRAEIISASVNEPVVLDEMDQRTKQISKDGITGDIPSPDLSKTRRMDTAQGKAVSAGQAGTRVNIPTPPVLKEEKKAVADKPHARPHYTEYRKTVLTPRGKKFFITGAVLTSPLILLCALAYFGIFALCVCSVAVMIAVLLVIMCALITAGSLLSLVGIVYGIVLMFSTVGVGLYEIGVAVIVGGLSIIVSVLIYLSATGAMPYLMRQLIAFFRHTLKDIPPIVDRIREECNKL